LKSGSDKEKKDTNKVRMKNRECSPIMIGDEAQSGKVYFRSVKALPDYHLEVKMVTGSSILFDFRSRLNTVRFGKLRDEEMFTSVHTDGIHLIFSKKGLVPVKITAKEFMDLVLVDRTCPTHLNPE
jgi:two-component system chemotaxis response regulator CheY